MKNKKAVGITVGDLLKNTVKTLTTRNAAKEISLPDGAEAEIANDSDWHRTRVGYMHYEKVNLLNIGDRNWAIGRGEKWGSYPAEPYDSDILALRFDAGNKTDGRIVEEIRRGIETSSYFQNSLVYGYADGNLGVCKSGRFGEEILKALKPKVSSFIAQKAEYDEEHILMSTLQYPTTQVMLYKPNFVDFLTETIEKVLKEDKKPKESD